MLYIFDSGSKAQPATSDRVDPLHIALVLTRPCRVNDFCLSKQISLLTPLVGYTLDLSFNKTK